MDTNRTKRGFTLVELLVVVAIIALLLSILLPALGKAKELARGAVCMSQIKQIASAQFMYCSDWKDFIAPGAINAYWEKSGVNGAPYNIHGRFSDAAFLGEYLNNPDDKPYGRNARLPGTRSVFYCPSNKIERNVKDNNQSYLAYGFNVNISSVSIPGAGAYKGLTVWVMSRMGSLESTSMFPLFVDGEIEWRPGKANQDYCYGVKDEEAIPGYQVGWEKSEQSATNWRKRHYNGATNVAFLDGHAETYVDLRQEHLSRQLVVEPDANDKAQYLVPFGSYPSGGP